MEEVIGGGDVEGSKDPNLVGVLLGSEVGGSYTDDLLRAFSSWRNMSQYESVGVLRTAKRAIQALYLILESCTTWESPIARHRSRTSPLSYAWQISK